MENEISDLKDYKLSFHGQGKAYFGIVIVNWLLTIITLGFYYPWAKARNLKYLYGSTSLNTDRFTFHGTGKEMFSGFIKAIIIIVVIYGLAFLFAYLEMPILGSIIFYFSIIALFPVAIHGSYRYRFSRTSWRGIRFGYRGDRSELFLNYFKWTFFSIVTLGIYGSWMEMKLRNYLINNIRAGNVEFNYKGAGYDYFIMNVKGLLLSLITLGVYSFWWYRSLLAYYVDNLSLHKNGQQIRMKSMATAGDIFNLFMGNILIFIFSLGLGYAWMATRTMNFMTSKIMLKGNMDLDTIQQTEDDYSDATGEDLSGFLDINFII